MTQTAGWAVERALPDDLAIKMCKSTARIYGHTAQQAIECVDGEVGCPDCPFIPRIIDRQTEKHSN